MRTDNQGLRRSRHFCDGLGMWVVNVLPACIPATGVCFPSFFSQVAFNDTDDEESSTANTMQENVDELIQIWDGDGTLRSNADSLGDFYSRVLDDWRNGGSWAYSEVFTSARYNDMDAQIISRVYASASGALRADLDNLRGVLQSKIGLTLGQIFDADFGRYGPGGGPCDGRWKDDGAGGCYWDSTDCGPDQCTPCSGRYKLDGSGNCYWDPNDCGPNQCTPDD